MPTQGANDIPKAYFTKCWYCVYRDKQGTWCHLHIKDPETCVDFEKEVEPPCKT